MGSMSLGTPAADLTYFEPDRTSGLLIAVVQQLSLARSLDAVMAIVRSAARQLTGADGATFVLKDNGHCFYADEDAISPLWKGQRFPLETCISGWAMIHRKPVAIEDIFVDPRVPHDAYRPTFVKSLVMVPIRTLDPVGAIGTYWARPHRATESELRVLAALADSTSITLENVQLYQTLERKVEERTAQLAASRAELELKHEALVRAERQREALTALLVHDIKSPANGIVLSSQARLRKATLSPEDRRSWTAVKFGADAINRVALNLLDLSAAENGCFTLRPSQLDLGALLEELVQAMAPHAEDGGKTLELAVTLEDRTLTADVDVLRRVFQNVVDNALRHSPRGGTVRLSVGQTAGGLLEVRVIDEGEGIPEAMRDAVFDRYTRVSGPELTERGNHGLGLTFCRLAVERHQGTIHVEGHLPTGSEFVIRLPRGP